jgi:hypothetical protein
MSIDPRTGVRVGLAFVLLGILTHTRADPDLWGHVVFGRDTIAGGAVPTVDPYSFASDTTWVNHGWLGDVFIYLAYLTGGGAGLIVLRMAPCWERLPVSGLRSPGSTWMRARAIC